ncbi:hypothetical protein A3B87_01455 [Candidatus Kuenenbacteria bacterium RIFCSPHIGHO2_02_FULL_39_13]|uniref:Uncharacterized protein n=1 Tax=Candidatus Kuenenbacteria bacterium RIFCSPHIGHO2_02_FULL_39_13 TaxID=1798561 RepID=A0A1F6FNS4_9BACT|nr:MAG: hypothetical protein A3B87_01455 [Candidatus Kuenenbacteria bacterium RIFCSPHIGHO2_02_FULL_39_13]
MKIQLRKILNAAPSLRKLLNADIEITKAYHLSKLGAKVDSEIRQYEILSNAQIKKLGKELTAGQGNYKITPGTPEFKKYQEEMEKLQDMEVDIRNYKPVELTPEDCVDMKLSAMDLVQLEPFIVFKVC